MSIATSDSSVVVRCQHCNASNRIPIDRLIDPSRCGRCHQKVHDPGESLAIDSSSAETLIRCATSPVLLEFWSRTATATRFLDREMVRVARDMARDLLVATIDLDDDAQAAARFGIQALPSLRLYREGAEVWRDVGARTAVHLENDLRSVLAHAA